MSTEKPLKIKKLMLYILIFSLVVSAITGIIILLMGDFGDTEARILGTTGSLGICTIFGLSSSVLYEKNRIRWLALTGLLLASLSFILILIPVWGPDENFDYFMRIAFSVLVAAFSVAYSCLLCLIIPKSNLVKWLLRMTHFFNACFTVLLIVMILLEFEGFSDFWVRLLGVLAILGVLGTILSPLLHRFLPQKNDNEKNLKE